MARIPGAEGLGEQVARPQRFNETQVARDALGGGFARTLQAVGGDMLAQQQRADSLADAERRRAEAEALAERKAADKAQALGVLQRAQDEFKTLGDEFADGVRSGSRDKRTALQDWEEATRDRLTTFLEEVPQDHAGAVRLQLEHGARQLARTAVGKAVRERDRADTMTGIDQTLEGAQRLYRTDPKAADDMAAAALEQLGPAAGLAPDKIAGKLQAWREGAQFTRAYEAVSAGRDDKRALDAAEKLIADSGFLDPQRRAVLSDRVAAYRLAIDQRAELEAQRALRRQEVALKRAEAEYTAATALADKGVLSPAYADQVLSKLAGTPYQAAFRELLNQQAVTGPLAAQPIVQQRAELDRVNAAIAQQGLTPGLQKRREQIERTLRGSETDLGKDPLRAGAERGVIEGLQPVNLSNPQALAQTAVQRVAQAEAVSRWAGEPVSPLTSEEADGFRRMLDTLPAKERAGAVATVAQAIGPQAAAGLAKQLDPKDGALSLAISMAGARTTEGRLTAELVLKGQQAKRDGTSTKDESKADLPAAQWRPAMSRYMVGRENGSLFENAAFDKQVLDAAEYIAHGIASENGGRLTKDDMKRAVRLAVGGDVIEFNGRRLPIPAGVTEEAFRKRVASVSADELQRQAPDGTVIAAGVALPVAEFAKALPAQKLVPLRPGEFAVMVGNRPVTNAAGDIIAIGVR